jgi:hypothetical protein
MKCSPIAAVLPLLILAACGGPSVEQQACTTQFNMGDITWSPPPTSPLQTEDGAQTWGACLTDGGTLLCSDENAGGIFGPDPLGPNPSVEQVAAVCGSTGVEFCTGKPCNPP